MMMRMGVRMPRHAPGDGADPGHVQGHGAARAEEDAAGVSKAPAAATGAPCAADEAQVLSRGEVSSHCGPRFGASDALPLESSADRSLVESLGAILSGELQGP